MFLVTNGNMGLCLYICAYIARRSAWRARKIHFQIMSVIEWTWFVPVINIVTNITVSSTFFRANQTVKIKLPVTNTRRKICTFCHDERNILSNRCHIWSKNKYRKFVRLWTPAPDPWGHQLFLFYWRCRKTW